MIKLEFDDSLESYCVHFLLTLIICIYEVQINSVQLFVKDFHSIFVGHPSVHNGQFVFYTKCFIIGEMGVLNFQV